MIMIRKQNGYSTLQGLVALLIIFFGFAFVVEIASAIYSYNYIKTQMDMSNRAVYKLIDFDRLARREIYINETNGASVFADQLRENLKLDAGFTPTGECPIRIIGQVEIESFEIYNQEELPAITPVGTSIDFVAVHSRLSVTYRPVFLTFLPITFHPYMDTDVPDSLLKTYHP